MVQHNQLNLKEARAALVAEVVEITLPKVAQEQAHKVLMAEVDILLAVLVLVEAEALLDKAAQVQLQILAVEEKI